jgi:murein L,D-transpeptidase YcbB/YkuD
MRGAPEAVAAVVVAALLVSGLAATSSASSDDTSGLRLALTATARRMPTPHPVISEAMAAFYEGRAHRRAWFDGLTLTSSAHDLVERVAHGERDGLPALRALRALVDALVSADEIDGADVLLTEVFLTYGLRLRWGQLAPEALHRSWHTAVPPRPDLLGALTAAAADGRVDEALDELAPPTTSYRGLRETLLRYLDVAATGGWVVLPDGPPLASGDADPRVRDIRAHLRLTGDLRVSPAGDDMSEEYDAVLAAAIRHFQRRHGLAVDGVVGPVTRAALNVPVAARIRQLALNMERQRWLPPLPPRCVLVNVPGRRLTLVERGREVAHLGAHAGAAYRSPALVADEIHDVVMLPVGGATAAALHLPFARFAASLDGPLAPSGYIVVEDPVALAAFALAGHPWWTRETIQTALARGEAQRIALSHALPVYLLYWTAWVEADGTVSFRDDRYGLDERLTLALLGPATPSPPSATSAVAAGPRAAAPPAP